MRGFNIKEYKQRVIKAKKLMENDKIDIILITSPSNFRYFTGLDSNFWESPTRPWFLLIPMNQDPIAIIPSIGKAALEKTWINNIKTWQSPNPNDEGISILKKIISDQLSSKGNIGCELGLENFLRINFSDFDKLRKSLSNHRFIDASNIFWNLRMIKSKNEINKLKKIISITSHVFDNFSNKIKLNMTENEIASVFKKELINNGADYVLYMACTSGKGGYSQIICNASEKKIRNGDVVIIDTGSVLDGYFCDFDRNYGIGKISPKTVESYSKLWEATEKTLEIIKPGITCSEVYNSLKNNLFKNNSNISDIGRMGHGLGLQLTEPPSIMKNEKSILQNNMVITIEPSIEYEKNKILVMEENILITKNGYELLNTRSPQNLPIIKL